MTVIRPKCWVHSLAGIDAEMNDNGQGALVCVLDQGHFAYIPVQAPN